MYLNILTTLFIALSGGLLFKKIKVPAAFMTGGMIAVATMSIISNQMIMPSSMKFIAQIISGAYIGQQSSKNTLLKLKQLLFPICLLMLLFTINCFALSTVFVAFFKMDWVTALLSCLPGGIMDVSLISIDMGANSETVATMQLARLVGMLIILPQWSKLIMGIFKNKYYLKSINNQGSKKILITEDKLSFNKRLLNDFRILTISFLGGCIGYFIGIPVGALVLSLIFSFIFKQRFHSFTMSPYIRYGAQLLAASIIGSNFTINSVLQMKTLLFPIVLLFTGFLLVNILFTWITSRAKILDVQSALFASSPAGATDISLIAADLGGDLPSIASIQITRTLFAILILPQIIHLFIK